MIFNLLFTLELHQINKRLLYCRLTISLKVNKLKKMLTPPLKMTCIKLFNYMTLHYLKYFILHVWETMKQCWDLRKMWTMFKLNLPPDIYSASWGPEDDGKFKTWKISTPHLPFFILIMTLSLCLRSWALRMMVSLKIRKY